MNILVMVGEDDSPYFKRQSVMYYERLKLTFPNTEFWKSNTDDHFTIVQNMGMKSTSSAERVQEFLKTHVLAK